MNVHSRLSSKSAKALFASLTRGTEIIIRLRNPEDYLLGEIGEINGATIELLENRSRFVVNQPRKVTVPFRRVSAVKIEPRKSKGTSLPPAGPGMF